MPSASTITASDVAAAVSITADTSADYCLTDAYGITYTGAPAHLALSALARPDLTAWPHHIGHAAQTRVRWAAHTLIDWFTSVHVDPGHADEFAALTPLRVCELIAYLATAGDPDVLTHVGPESLRAYTEHLLHDAVPNPDCPLPQLIDSPYRSLAGIDGTPRRLQVSATASNGADTVPILIDIQADQRIHWEFTAPIPIPVDKLDILMRDPDYLLGDYLSDNRHLIEDHLTYCNADSEDGVSVDATPATPRTSPARWSATASPSTAAERARIGG